MASKIITKGLKRTALSVALGMCFAGSVYAQSNSAGAIAGTTTAGATVVVENAATGFRRELTADASGGYRITNIPTGTYTVTAEGKSRTVNVSIGGTANATQLETVTVVGGTINAIDVASVESSTILTAEQIDKIPVPQNITSVALLAPGTVKGDAAFGNLASFGGGAVSENQYFVNGFNITNSFKNLNFGQVPFEGIAEQQIKTGGYGAEYGRATGGVINLVTKRGSNEFHAGGNIVYTPESLRGHNPDVYYNDARYPDGKRHVSDNSEDTLGTTILGSVWASGALVKDRLFGYALIQYAEVSDRDTYGSIFGTTSNTISQEIPTWLVKLDWNINDSHILELTAFSDTIKQDTDVYSNAAAARSVANAGPVDATANTGNPTPAIPYPALTPSTTDLSTDVSLLRTGKLGTVKDESGGESWSLKYTGYLTDSFTLSALYGEGESSRSNYGIAANGTVAEYFGEVGGPVAGCPIIGNITGAVPPNCSFIGLLGSKNAKDERKQFRLDADWTIGDHQIGFGYDADEFTSVDGEAYEGGAQWVYQSNPLAATPSSPGSVRWRLFQSGATVKVDSEAWYLEDNWQVTPNFLAYVGLRWDTFENINGDGETFVKIENQFAPRLGFSWDVNGDSSFKVYGTAGRYALPLTATVAVRGASKSLFAEQYWSFTGIDPVTGAPTGAINVGNPNCGGCETRYLNNEFGVAKNPATVADTDLSPMYQDEYILGFQTQLTDNISGGVRGIYRDLKAAIDDQCDYRAVFAWANENGFSTGGPDNSYGFNAPPPGGDEPGNPLVHAYNPGFAFCHLYNPGEDATFMMDIDGNGVLEEVNLAADILGPSADRTYKALEFFAEGNYDKFFWQASYTWSKSRGNTEGGVKSDIGQDDTGTTQDFDYPELTIGSLGFLPNDRRHAIKAFGSYSFSDEWALGANILIQSGRPKNCFGFLGGAFTSGYANGYFSCDEASTRSRYVSNPNWIPQYLPDGVTPNPANPCGNSTGSCSGNRRNLVNGANTGGNDNGSTVVSRGSRGRTEWQRTLDLNLRYTPKWAEGLLMQVNVFNVFNEHAVTTVVEQGENTAGEPQPDRYGTPTGFQAPRAVQFTVQYDF